MSVHINAKPGDIAESILLPGDPLRAKFIAENFLEDAVLYNEVRGMLGYTGYYKGKRISVQGTGMGLPSISIYLHELMRDFGVQKLMRIGTCGSIHKDIKLKDVVLGQASSTNNAMNLLRFDGMSYAPIADFELLKQAYDLAKERNIDVKVGNILASDTFYDDDYGQDPYQKWRDFGVMVVEMESAALYTLAAKYGRKALTLLTVSDSLVTGEQCSAEERQLSFTEMMEIALEIA